MVAILTALAIITGLLGTIGGVVFVQSRKLLREQKNFERGLKMVPLLIHLPPISEDTEVGGRDVRDIVDENISKAQILYGIIASTLQKGFKSRLYGQRHCGFEIIGANGVVQFYAAVPVALVDVVKQAVISAYPTARLEEVAEHNMFSPVGKINGTTGGELVLKELFAYPIATYQEVKRDAMQSLLNALSTLENEDGVGIQLLLRPAGSGWRKKASGIAGKKRAGKDSKKGPEKALAFMRDIATTVAKGVEEGKNSKVPDKPELSALDQSILDAIDDKTRHPGFEVLIRIVVSSNVLQRSQAILNNVVAAFALFDAPGKNGFKFSPAKDIESFVTAYILRLFPPEVNKNVLNSVELASIFHFPDQRNIPTSQLERQSSKQVDGPRNVPQQGLLLGYNVFRGTKKPIRLSIEDRRRHIYLVGQTGVGKSNLLENLALQDMLDGRGFAFVDPHGDTAERLLAMIPRERTEDVVYFCPADMDYPMGLNLFEFDNPDQKDFLVQEAINMIYKLYDPQHQGIVGPRFEVMFRNAALTIMADPDGGSFVDIPKLYSDPSYLKQKLKHVTDQRVLDYWNKEVPMSQRSNDYGEVVAWMASKFGAFLSNEMMRNIIGQTKSAFKLRDVMDNKKILLVNLSKGRTGDLNSRLLGMIFVMKFQAAAMSRANIAEEERGDFCLYVDEFQNFSTDSFATILSEARKYRLNLVVANQFTTQLTDEVKDAVFGNVGSMVAFRVGTDADADALVKKFQPTFEREDILRLPNYNTITQVLIGGVPSQPFSMATIPPLGTPNPKLGEALKQLSAAKYGRPRAVVEKEVDERLKSQEITRPSTAQQFPYKTGTPGAFNSPLGGGSIPPKTATSGSSFLDEWLAKRKTQTASPSPSFIPQSASPPLNQFSPSPVTTPLPAQLTSSSLTPLSRQPNASAFTTPISGQSTYPTNPISAMTPSSQPDPLISNKLSGEVRLGTRQGTPDSTGSEDTIKIDQDGNLTTVE